MQGEFTQVLEDLVGRSYLRDRILKVQEDIARTKPRLEPTSNPVMRYLGNVTTLGSRRIFYNLRAAHRLTDEIYFNVTARLLQYLEPELNANVNYKKQCLLKLFAREEGPFHSAFTELLCAGYLKSLGHSVRLNSSAEAGMPDVVSTYNGKSYGHDAKMFADEDIHFISKVNKMLPDFVKDYGNGKYRGLNLQATVNDTAGFTAARLKEAIDTAMSGGPGVTNGIFITNFPYIGDQGIQVNFPQIDFHLRVIPGQPLDKAVEDFSRSLEHSIEQIHQAGLTEGVSWAFFTHDNQYNMKQTIVEQLTEIVPEHVRSGIGLVMMEFKPMVEEQEAGIKSHVFSAGMSAGISQTSDDLTAFLDELNIRPA